MWEIVLHDSSKNIQLTHIRLSMLSSKYNEKKEQDANKDFNFFSKEKAMSKHRFLTWQFCHLMEC